MGLVFAFGFRRDALDVGPPQREFGVVLRSVGNGLASLEAERAHPGIGHPGTIGVWWEEGYGRVGDVVDAFGLSVTRHFEEVAGVGPPVCEEPSVDGCTPVDLEGYAYPSDPSDRGLEFHDVRFDSPLGSLEAWVVPSGSGSRWAIHVHGWKAEKREAIRMLPPYREAGVTSMVINYRNDPGSPVDPTGRYRIGLSEWEDLEAAVRHAVSNGADEILLAGYSTGCAVVMAFLEESELASRTVGVVLDAPNIIWADVVRANTRDTRFPVIGFRPTRLMKEVGLWMADLLWQVDWERTNYVQRAERFLTVPTLVFHGTSDRRVPIAVSRQLEAAVPDHVTLVETPAAGHVMSWNADPDRYEDRLSRYLARI